MFQMQKVKNLLLFYFKKKDQIMDKMKDYLYFKWFFLIRF